MALLTGLKTKALVQFLKSFICKHAARQKFECHQNAQVQILGIVQVKLMWTPEALFHLIYTACFR